MKYYVGNIDEQYDELKDKRVFTEMWGDGDDD